VSKTVNVDYDPKQLKPFLKKLAKKDAINKMKPLGLANESHFPPDLRIKYQYMLAPVAQEDPDMLNIMGAPAADTTAKFESGSGAGSRADRVFV